MFHLFARRERLDGPFIAGVARALPLDHRSSLMLFSYQLRDALFIAVAISLAGPFLSLLICSLVSRSCTTEKPVINPFLFASDLREGMRTTVVCSVLSGQTPLTFSWLKDGRPLHLALPDADAQRFDEFTSRYSCGSKPPLISCVPISLTLRAVERRHAGNYTCRVSHATNPNVSAAFTAPMVVLGALL